jgi:hypothetical protein
MTDGGPYPGQPGYREKPYVPPPMADIELPGPATPALFRGTVARDRVIWARGHGGIVEHHVELFERYRDAGTKVGLRGPCYSACTQITAFIKPENLCIAEGAFLAFHSARGMHDRERRPLMNTAMYMRQTPKVRAWLDEQGGPAKLPMDGWWTMYDHDLWVMGYPRCAP